MKCAEVSYFPHKTLSLTYQKTYEMKYTIVLFLVLLLSSCKQEASSKVVREETKNTEVSQLKAQQEKQEDVTEPKTNSTFVNDRSRNSKLLQGLWEDIGDSTKRVEFKNSKKIDMMQDVQPDEGSTFAITDKCEETNINIQGESKGRFITVPSLNKCYYIALLNGKTLHLGDLSNGKTFKYKKVLPN